MLDRANEAGDVVQLQHVNCEVPDQYAAQTFYVVGLGLTRDPYLQTGLGNMWVNVGRSQFHLPTGGPTVLRGIVGIVMPGRKALLDRLGRLRDHFAGTRFAFAESNSWVDVVSPWGNRYRVHEPAPEFAPMWLGIPYVEFEVPMGAADKIARFYQHMLSVPAKAEGDGEGRVARVRVGVAQHLLFREKEGEPPPYDGHHVQLYITNRFQAMERLAERKLLIEEATEYEFRFDDIIDLDSGRVLFTLNHEMRTVAHPMFARHLVNRNPTQGVVDYAMGYDDQWTSPAQIAQ